MDRSTPESQPIASTRLSRRTILRRGLLSAAIVGGGFWSSRVASEESSNQRKFKLPSESAPIDTVACFQSRMIEHSQPLGFVHCASISQSSTGKTVCTWYGGRREGSRDVRIWLAELGESSRAAQQWTEPRSVMTPAQASTDTNQFVRKVGNAVSFFDSSDRLWMIYVSIAMGGWATSSLNATYSEDMGATWSRSQRLWLSPALNISHLVRCPPVMMTNGDFGLPIYNECAGIFPEMLWLGLNSNTLEYRKTRICGGRDWLQPSLVPTGDQTAICYLRCLNESRRVGYATTQDAGESWTQPKTLDLPNPNSAVCAVLMRDSGVLMALNYSNDSRDSISLVYSANGVDGWRSVATLDHEPGEKFSYPSMIRCQDGLIHLVYSWKMQKIRHLSFNDAWVDVQLESGLPKRFSTDVSEQAAT